MAELHVQRKGRAIWPWMVACLVALTLLFLFLWSRKDSPDVGATNATDSSAVAAALNRGDTGTAAGTLSGTAVTDYLRFVDSRTSRSAGLAHEYTADGLRQLASAMKEVATGDTVGGVALQPRIDAIRQRADAIQQNPDSRQHALQVREAFILTWSLMGQMNRGAGDNTAGNLDALKAASTAIEPSRPLLEQANQVEQFFEKAGEALRNMTGATK